MPEDILFHRRGSRAELRGAPFESGETYLNVLARLRLASGSDRYHVPFAEDSPVEVQTYVRCGSASRHRLYRHDRVLSVLDYPRDRLDLDLHQEAHAVEDLNIRLDVIPVSVAVVTSSGICADRPGSIPASRIIER